MLDPLVDFKDQLWEQMVKARATTPSSACSSRRSTRS